MRKIGWIAALLFVGLHEVVLSTRAQEAEERDRRPASSREILKATGDFARTVNGNAVVRNRCRVQGKESEIEETAEVIKRDGCKLILKARKVTAEADDQAVGHAAAAQQEIEFTMYADLSELTTPVLVETQKFDQCESTGAPVLKLSSRSEPGKILQVIRKSHADGGTKDDAGAKQTRRDLSLFFSSAAAAEKARRALARAVRSCGGKEWPDEDDLP
ncbi:MAG TPA: hypothetical protein VH350_00390 [Candidatus Sulfotelmatobacter sp.]|nr:hypothetical protein [Candidatus Sulfotelmatobacter sp.]